MTIASPIGIERTLPNSPTPPSRRLPLPPQPHPHQLPDPLHRLRYRHFEQQQIPLGSGMLESACKSMIQQRFKGVGMRWSEDGFNHLLILRVAWVNERFDHLFPHVTIAKTKAFPIH